MAKKRGINRKNCDFGFNWLRKDKDIIINIK